MGEARRRKEKLGDAYGKPDVSNDWFIAYRGLPQAELDQKALQQICQARAKGEPVTLIGTEAARPLAQAAGLPWLHELSEGEPVPQWLAWNPVVAMNGGPMLQKSHRNNGGIVILGAGTNQCLELLVGIFDEGLSHANA